MCHPVPSKMMRHFLKIWRNRCIIVKHLIYSITHMGNFYALPDVLSYLKRPHDKYLIGSRPPATYRLFVFPLLIVRRHHIISAAGNALPSCLAAPGKENLSLPPSFPPSKSDRLAGQISPSGSGAHVMFCRRLLLLSS